MTAKIRGRFAPSPTGEIHLGNAWTALLAWLQVRAAGGTMVLRVEDLDPDRSRHEYISALIKDMRWLGLDWDEGPDIGGPYGPYCQNERRMLYQEALEYLKAKGLVYPCYCTRAEIAASAPHAGENNGRYPGTCRARKTIPAGRKPSLRLKVPDKEIKYHDLICGSFAQHMSESGDFIIRRSDGIHAYQLAVVVDDGLMNITNVVRGNDLLDSTPRQLLLYSLLNLIPPSFAHVPLLIGQDGHRLSKRQRDLSIAALRQRGFAPEDIIGYLGWKARLIDRPYQLTASDLIEFFAIEKLPVGSVVVEESYFSEKSRKSS